MFVHAHPDDEAIFTAGTMALLSDAGHRVVLVVTTSGEQGAAGPGVFDLGRQREAETLACCSQIGDIEVHFLRFEDSGFRGENPAGFAHVSVEDAGGALVGLLEGVGPIEALVGYDDHGIYGHPDHVKVHEIVAFATERLGVTTTYESTVDREYLHFVETHVVVEAALGERPLGRGLAASDLGLPSVLIDTTVDVGAMLEQKRRAMTAHTSQLPADAPVFALGEANFAAVYGYEWYARLGPPGPIETLPSPPGIWL